MIELRDIDLQHPGFRLDGVNFTIPAGQYAVLMGRTGAGKTTLLEAIAGLRNPTRGRILLNRTDVTIATPAQRNIGYVPQDPTLFPMMTVRENLAFALTVRGQPRETIQNRVKELAGWLDLETILDRRAVGLSGGESQRVALGRALAHRPPVLLLDEPFNAVDEETRDRLLTWLTILRDQRTTTILHVTHHRAEAERLADRHYRLESGRIISGNGTDL